MGLLTDSYDSLNRAGQGFGDGAFKVAADRQAKKNAKLQRQNQVISGGVSAITTGMAIGGPAGAAAGAAIFAGSILF